MARIDSTIKSIQKLKSFEDAYEFLQELPSHRRTKEVYKSITEKSKTFKDVQLIFEDMDKHEIPVNDKIFRSFLMRTKDDSQILDLLDMIGYYQKKFNEMTQRELLNKLKETSSIERVFSLLKEDNTASLYMYEKIIYKSKNFQEIIPYLNKMKNCGIWLTNTTCNIVMGKIDNLSDGMLFAYDMVEQKVKLRDKVCLKLISFTSNIHQLNELANLFEKEPKSVLSKPMIYKAYHEKKLELEQLEKNTRPKNCVSVNDTFEFKKVDISELKKRYAALYDENQLSESLYFTKSDEELHEHINFLATEINVKTINIATGFLYKSGIERILQTIEKSFKNQGPINILAGNLQKYPAALKNDIQVTQMDKKTADYLNVCMFKYPIYLKTIENRFFHGKFYLFEGTSKAFVIVGSANISASGFCGNHEFNVLYILDVNSKMFKQFKSEFNNIWNESTSINHLDPEKFSDIDMEYDQLSNKPKPYKKMDDDEFDGKIKDLPEEEIKQRLSLWKSREPRNIYKDLGVAALKDYVLFEYPEYNLLVFESFQPANAYYCFKGNDVTALIEKIKHLQKRQIEKLSDKIKKGNHVQDYSNLESNISHLFTKK